MAIDPKYAALFLFAVTFGFAGVNVQAAPGDGIPFTEAEFVDSSSGNTYKVQIQAHESATEAGVGYNS